MVIPVMAGAVTSTAKLVPVVNVLPALSVKANTPALKVEFGPVIVIVLALFISQADVPRVDPPMVIVLIPV